MACASESATDRPVTSTASQFLKLIFLLEMCQFTPLILGIVGKTAPRGPNLLHVQFHTFVQLIAFRNNNVLLSKLTKLYTATTT